MTRYDDELELYWSDGEDNDFPKGWYFSTESEDLEGPYPTVEKVREGQMKHALWLEKQTEVTDGKSGRGIAERTGKGEGADSTVP